MQMMKSTIPTEKREAVIQSRLDCPGMVSNSAKIRSQKIKTPTETALENFLPQQFI
jgi:hypothetical protein